MPRVMLIGFGAANNVGFQKAKGKYIILLNSDAFPHSGAIESAIQMMDGSPEVGLAGGRLVNKDGSWQPSSYLFPSLLNQFLKYTGLAHRFPHNPFFGRANRSWAAPEVPAEVDWVSGAFCIIRREALDKDKIFDEFYANLKNKKTIVPIYIVKSSSKIVNFKPEFEEKITDLLLNIENIHPGKQIELVKSAAIESFSEFYEKAEKKDEILLFVRSQLNSESPKTRKVAKEFISKWGEPT